jgi:hypothetical protein
LALKKQVVIIDDMPTTLAQFKKYLEKENIVESENEVERYLIDSCEDSNADKLCILGW